MMEYLKGVSKEMALGFLELAHTVARDAACSRAKCGVVIVGGDGSLLGSGFNSPAGNDESERRCERKKSEYHEKVTDKTCCIHAEQRAIMDALIAGNVKRLEGSIMYFVRLDDGVVISDEREPYCTICSKMMVEFGLGAFVRYFKGEVVSYDVREYNRISFDYHG
ncbi:MAG: hypothetical protein PHG66_03700 [Candidatus Colwellbacteria bacterium]|nr:hypothetical protein [Candidatus Colwellbacteria bacterium]